MLFLIPAYLSDESPIEYFSPIIREYIMKTNYFFVENEKTARKVIKFFAPEKKQSDLKLFLLDKINFILQIIHYLLLTTLQTLF